MKTRQQMNELGYLPDPAPAVMYFLTSRLERQRNCGHAEADSAQDFGGSVEGSGRQRQGTGEELMGKEAATPSRTWQLLSQARPEMILFLAVTARQQSGRAEDQEFLYQVAAGAAENSAAGDDGVADHAAVAGISEDCARCFPAAAGWQAAFADGDSEIFKPLAPPPPPPPPPPPAKRGRAAKGGCRGALLSAAAAARAAKKREARPCTCASRSS